MECLEHDLELVRHANDEFSRFFARFSGSPVMGTDDEVYAMREIEKALRSVGSALQGKLRTSSRSEVRDELRLYRENLLRLRHELAEMEGSAMACRARLFTRERHLDAARSWCQTARATD